MKILGVPLEMKRLDEWHPFGSRMPEVIFRRADGYDFWLHLSGGMLGSADSIVADGEFVVGKKYMIVEVPETKP